MDVNVRRAVTVSLRLRLIDVLTAQEDRAAELDDDILLERATELRRVFVSQDSDLLREGALWLSQGKAFSGIIYAHQLRVTSQMIEDLALIAKATTADDWWSKIEYLPLG
jgi:hypothetical protein